MINRELIPFRYSTKSEINNDVVVQSISLNSEVAQQFVMHSTSYRCFIFVDGFPRYDVSNRFKVQASNNQNQDVGGKYPKNFGSSSFGSATRNDNQNSLFLNPNVLNPTEYLKPSIALRFDFLGGFTADEILEYGAGAELEVVVTGLIKLF